MARLDQISSVLLGRLQCNMKRTEVLSQVYKCLKFLAVTQMVQLYKSQL